jgi:hypothetical protein
MVSNATFDRATQHIGPSGHGNDAAVDGLRIVATGRSPPLMDLPQRSMRENFVSGVSTLGGEVSPRDRYCCAAGNSIVAVTG